MQITYRKIIPAEYEKAKALWNVCFPEDAGGYSDYYFRELTSPDYVFAAFDGEKMVSALHMIPYALSFEGIIKPCVMIAGVATVPEYRMCGIAGTLIRVVHENAGFLGAVAAVLKPDADIYAGFGYVPFAYHSKYVAEKNEIGSALKSVTPEIMLGIYNEFARNYNGMMVRSVADMTAYLKEAELFGFAVCDESEETYALCWEGDDGISVAELVGKHPEELAKSIAAKGKNVEFRLPADMTAGSGGEKFMFSMICPLNETELLRGTGANSLEELINNKNKPPLTLEFC